MSSAGKIIFIAGPTGSGKSGLAISLAKSLNAEIINADAIQVYADLETLSARPDPAAQGGIAHHLFGYLDGAERCSAGQWARRAAPLIEEIVARGISAIIVGGTGLYLRALEAGLSPIPHCDARARMAAQARFEDIGEDAFYREVVAADPPMVRLARGDHQRLLRAWTVHHVSGLGLSHFQSLPREPLLKAPVDARIILLPPREQLYAQCDARFAAMVKGDGLDEARQLLDRGLAADLPVMKALGAAELMAHLRGEMGLEEAIEQAQRNTRRFAKRQMTWFRGQAGDWPVAQNHPQAESLIRQQLHG